MESGSAPLARLARNDAGWFDRLPFKDMPMPPLALAAALLCLSTLAAAAQAPPRGATGTIAGELSYPSDHIPEDLRICAQALDSKQRLCTTRKQSRGRKTRYELKVPPGTYHVFADSRSEWTGRPAYYSEFVTCGLDVKCPSHKPIPVTIAAGERRDGVHPGDWYAGN